MPPLMPALDLTALAVEAAAGYPQALFRRIGHPVTWMGGLLRVLDRRLNHETARAGRRRAAGAMSLGIVMAVSGLIAFALQAAILDHLARGLAVLLLGILASPCLAQRSLDSHVRAVRDALTDSGIGAGRAAAALIVGRDTKRLDEAGVARAAIESLAENFSDGIVAPSFYLALFGLPGGYVYKAINTADSMIGHKTPRHHAFGFAAAKLDDGVNWPAARLAALWIILAAALLPGASAREAWRITRRDAKGHPSPNAGWPEAAMAGALGTTLGGPRTYAGTLVNDAAIGDGPSASAATIGRALRIYRLACAINALFVLVLAMLAARWLK